jgi:hypothetical protein
MKRLALLLFIVALLAASASGATYFVQALTGSDAADGSFATPWLTIGKATSTVTAGDTVYVSGTFNERAAEATSGSAGSFITYISTNGAICLGFNNSGDYIRVIGFTMIHTNNLGYAPLTVSGDYNEYWYNTCFHGSDNNFLVNPTTMNNTRFIGNSFSWSGVNLNSNTLGNVIKVFGDNSSVNNLLWEYNISEYSDDHMNPSGTNYLLRNNRWGPINQANTLNDPHVDGVQCNAASRHIFVTRTWHIDNLVSNSHFVLMEAPVSGRSSKVMTYRNVTLRSGDQGYFQMRDATNLYSIQNTVGEIGITRGGPASSGFFYIFDDANGASISNKIFGNIYTNCTTSGGALYTFGGGGNAFNGFSWSDRLVSDYVGGSNGNVENTDPKFVGYDTNNVMLRSDSAAIDTMTNLTFVTSASSTGNSFVVDDSNFFYNPAAFGLPYGERIYVGTDLVTITNVDYWSKTIQTLESFTWAQNDVVHFFYRGSGPDYGAYEYGDAFLTAATFSASGNDYTCTPTGDAAFVVFHQNGIPHTIDYISPFTATITSGSVTVKAFAEHSQSNAVVAATLVSSDTTPYRNRGRGRSARGGIIP